MEARSGLESWLALTLERDPGMSETEWTAQLDSAPPGVDQALAALLESGRAADALRAVDALGAYWHWKAAFADGAAWSRRVLDAAPDDPPEQRARVLTSLAVMQFRCGETEACRTTSEEALALARRVSDPVMTTSALSSLARVGLRTHDFDLVRRMCAEAMSVAEASQRPELQRLPLHCLAEGTRLSGDLAGARPLYERSIDLNLQLGNEAMVAMERSNLAALETAAGNTARAQDLLEQSLAALQRLGDRYLLPYAVLNMGGVALKRGDARHATRLLAAADAMFRASGAAIDPADQPVFDAHVSGAREVLGAKGFDAAWAEGQLLSPDAAIAAALAGGATS
jgi:tetratricopeptide (TPR) repeat protein